MNVKYYILLVAVVFFSCRDDNMVTPDPTTSTAQNIILVEKLTGASCPNCPKGAETIESLVQQFDGSVIAVSVHGVQQAAPLPNMSIHDFRNPAAVEIEESFVPFLGKPSVVINRVQFEDQNFMAITGTSTWQSYIEQELNRPEEINLFQNVSYNELSRRIDVELTVTGIEDLLGDYFVTVLLTQSHIVDAQNELSSIIEDFEFNHVLMDAISNPLGDPLSTSISMDNAIQKSFSYTLPEEDGKGLWIAEDMEIVAFIENVDPADARIIQASKINVVE